MILSDNIKKTRDEDPIVEFANDMKDQMKLHEYKGPLLDNDLKKLLDNADYNLHGLKRLVETGKLDGRLLSEVCDLANYAMMISTIVKSLIKMEDL